MKQRNPRNFIEVKPHGNKKNIKENELFFDKKMPIGIVNKKLTDGWVDLQTYGVRKCKMKT